MRSIKFKVVNHEEFGIGLLPNIFQNWENYIPNFSLGHDLIDHTAKDESGELYQELRALGAHLFHTDFGKLLPYNIGNSGEISSINSKGNSLAYDFENSVIDASYDFDLPNVPKFVLTRYEKERFKILFEAFWNAITFETELFDDDFTCSKELMQKIESWFMYGYFNAKRRFKGERCDWLKQRINECLTNLKERNIFTESEEEFTLCYDKSGVVYVKGYW